MKATFLRGLIFLLAAMIIGLNARGWAEDLDAGKAQYRSNCAGCHGDDGEGKGMLSAKLRTTPVDLTTLVKRKNGVFPISTVFFGSVRKHNSVIADT
jgi:mono/diheme cytochrome c family protein